MSESTVYKIIGPTRSITSIINTTSTIGPVTVTASQNEGFNYAGFTLVGPSPVLVNVGVLGSNPGAVFPTTTSGPVSGFILPPGMTAPMLVGVPSNGFSFSVISNSTVASQLYITPMVAI